MNPRREYHKQWREKNKEKIQENGRLYYQDNKDKYRDWGKQRRDICRAKVLAFYGHKCACPGCDITYEEFLTLDHVHGDGAEHRRQRGVMNVYIWLCKTFPDGNFPKDRFRLLCWNCNCARGKRGYCPHEKEIDV